MSKKSMLSTITKRSWLSAIRRYYQKELAKRDKKMRQMEDSIRHLGARVEIYEITFDALREVDSATVDRVFHTIWNVREE